MGASSPWPHQDSNPLHVSYSVAAARLRGHYSELRQTSLQNVVGPVGSWKVERTLLQNVGAVHWSLFARLGQ